MRSSAIVRGDMDFVYQNELWLDWRSDRGNRSKGSASRARRWPYGIRPRSADDFIALPWQKHFWVESRTATLLLRTDSAGNDEMQGWPSDYGLPHPRGRTPLSGVLRASFYESCSPPCHGGSYSNLFILCDILVAVTSDVKNSNRVQNIRAYL